ncbi:MAG: hypothetical protein R2734_12660 [Nocardioides sp.]
MTNALTLDAPVERLLTEQTGRRGSGKRAAIVDRLGIRTVGDLLHHFPRRYLEMGELTKVRALAPGQLLTVVGEIAESERKAYTDRRTWPAGVPHRDPAAHRRRRPHHHLLREAGAPGRVLRTPVRRGSARHLRGPGEPVRPHLAAHQPEGGDVLPGR